MDALLPFLFLGAAVYMLWRAKNIRQDGVPVKVKVVKQKIDWGKSTTASPVFEIVSGPYQGEIAKSEVGTSLGVHRKGAILDGIYHPDTGAIESQTTLAIWEFVSWILLVGSIGYICWKFLSKFLLS